MLLRSHQWQYVDEHGHEWTCGWRTECVDHRTKQIVSRAAPTATSSSIHEVGRLFSYSNHPDFAGCIEELTISAISYKHIVEVFNDILTATDDDARSQGVPCTTYSAPHRINPWYSTLHLVTAYDVPTVRMTFGNLRIEGEPAVFFFPVACCNKLMQLIGGGINLDVLPEPTVTRSLNDVLHPRSR